MKLTRTQVLFLIKVVLDFRIRIKLIVPLIIYTITVTSQVIVEGRKHGHDKMSDVDVDTKQKNVVEFLTAEEISPEEIHARLKLVYGDDAVDLARVRFWAQPPGQSGRLVQRAIIQFLTAEGERPLEISQRLAVVYNTVPYSPCTVWRWAKRYSAGISAISDKMRVGRKPWKNVGRTLNSSYLDRSVSSSSEYS